MAAFWLKVIASDHVFYNGNCESLVVPAHDGEVGILPHREAMILAIQEGELRFRVPGENQYREAVVGIGIVQVANNRVTVVVDTAERPEDIDEVRARQALERAQEQLSSETEYQRILYVKSIHGPCPQPSESQPSIRAVNTMDYNRSHYRSHKQRAGRYAVFALYIFYSYSQLLCSTRKSQKSATIGLSSFFGPGQDDLAAAFLVCDGQKFYRKMTRRTTKISSKRSP